MSAKEVDRDGGEADAGSEPPPYLRQGSTTTATPRFPLLHEQLTSRTTHIQEKHIMRLPQPPNCHYQPLVLLSASLVAAQWWRWRLQQRAGTEILARAIPMSCTLLWIFDSLGRSSASSSSCLCLRDCRQSTARLPMQEVLGLVSDD